jgi:adenylate kinase
LNIVILGPPGAGKGTYARLLSEKHNIPTISVGDLFRKAITDETELGRTVKNYLSSGELVPDKIVIDVVKNRLEEDDCKKGFLLDGYPRTVPQAEAMMDFKKIDVAFNFIVPDDVIATRIGGRRTCSKCGTIFHLINVPPKVDGICDRCSGLLIQRADEKPQIIKNRLEVFRKKTKPVADYLRAKDLVVDIDANYPFEEIDKIIDQCENHLRTIKSA